MISVCLIIPNAFPVPAVKGGAVETLVNNLIDENEIYGNLKIAVVSIYDDQAKMLSEKYKNTEFIYIKAGKYEGTKDLYFSQTNQYLSDYVDSIEKELENREFDFIIAEGGYIQEYKKLLSKYPKNKCMAHIHGNYEVDEVVDSIYEYYICISDYIAKHIGDIHPVDVSRIKVLYNGIKIENFNKKISDEEIKRLKNKFNIKLNENIIMFCGRTTERKGIKELIKAFKLMKNLNNSKLLIVGNSNFGEEVKTQYDIELQEEAESIKDRVIFTGFVPNDQLYKFYNIADVATFPTINEEPFGLVAIEAMAAGCSLILTNSGAFPEIAQNTSIPLINKGEDLVENLAKAIDKCIDNKDKREIVVAEEQNRAKDFSNEAFYKNFVKLLEEIKNKEEGNK